MGLNAGMVAAYLTLDTSMFSAGLSTAKSLMSVFQNDALNLSQKLSAGGKLIQGVGKSLTMSLTAPILAMGAAAAKSFITFDDAARKVETLADTSVVSAEALRAGVLSLSQDTGVAASTLSEGLYQVLSAINDTENALGYTEIAAKAAIGGFTDTATAVDGLSSVMNAYGLRGTEAMQSVADMMLTAQNIGKTTFGEISSSIGNVIPLAAQLQVGVDELFSALAALTKQGIGTSEAITGLKAVFSNVLKPSSEAAKVAEQLGLDFSAAALQAKGLGAFLLDIVEKTGGSTEAMSALFGSVEALNSVLALAGKTGQADFALAMAGMSESAGAVQSAFDTMESGVGGALRRLGTSIASLGVSFGEHLAPMVQGAAEWVANLAENFANMDEGMQTTIVTVAAVAAAVGPVIMVLGSLITALGVLFSPVGLVMMGVAGLAALAVYLGTVEQRANAADEALRKSLMTASAESKAEFDLGVQDVEKTVKATVTVESEIINNTSTEVDAIFASLYAAIAAGREPTADEKAACAKALQTYFDGLTGDVDLQTSQQLQAAFDAYKNGEINASEYATQCASINEAAKAAKEALEAQEIAAIDTVNGLNTQTEAGADAATAALNRTKEAVTATVGAVKLLNTDGAITGIDTLYDKIRDALTDGMPDTAQVIEELQTEAQTYYDSLMSGIKLDTETQLAALNEQLRIGTMTQAEYEKKVAELTERNNRLIASIESVKASTIAYITQMAGQSTGQVRASLDELEGLRAEAARVYSEIEQMTAETRKMLEVSQQLVIAGLGNDPRTVGQATNITTYNYQKDKEEIEQDAQTKLEEAQKAWAAARQEAETSANREEGLAKADTEYATAKGAIEEESSTKLETLKQNTLDTIYAMFEGISGAQPEVKAKLEAAFQQLDLAGAMQEVLEMEPQDMSSVDTDLWNKILRKIGFTDETLSAEQIKALLANSVTRSIITFGMLETANALYTEATTAIEGLNKDGKFDLYALILDSLLGSGLAGETGGENDGGELGIGAGDSNIVGRMRAILGDPESLTESVASVRAKLEEFDALNQAVDEAKAKVDAKQKALHEAQAAYFARVNENVGTGVEQSASRTSALKSTMEEATAELELASADLDAALAKLTEYVIKSGTASAQVNTETDALTTAGNGLANAASALGPRIKGSTSTSFAGQDFKGIGANAVASITTGATSKEGELVAKFAAIGAAAAQAVRDSLGMASPSKVFRGIAHNALDSMMLGVDDRVQTTEITFMQAGRRMALATASGVSESTVPKTGGNGMVVNVNNPMVRTDADVRVMARQLGRYMRLYGG